MKPPRWDQVNALLDEVLSLPAEQRAAYLQIHCKDDPDLLREVSSLLQAHEGAKSFLEEPADEFAATLVAQEGEGDPLIGREVDGYRILEVLGRGGMGVVYKARNLTLDRIEALKVIAPFLIQKKSFLRRFQLEAKALAKIQHPNIVTVYTLRESWIGHYITMEFVEGRTLADELAEQGALPWQRTFSISKQLLGAFEYAHQRGIIHRDIKPRNIMLTPEGTVKVMDFGLAKFFLQQDATQTQGVSGTLCYMSPEQIKGADLDQRSDLFSLGLTLYEMVSGRLPFDRNASQFGIQRAIVEDEFRAPHQFNHTVPTPLSTIIMKALEKEPDQRYQRAQEMLDDLARYADDTVDLEATIVAAPSSSRREAVSIPSLSLPKKWGRVLVGVVLAGLLIWGAYAMSPLLLGTGADQAAPPTEKVADDAEQDTPAPTDTEPGDADDASSPASASDQDALADLPIDESISTEPEPRREAATPSRTKDAPTDASSAPAEPENQDPTSEATKLAEDEAAIPSSETQATEADQPASTEADQFATEPAVESPPNPADVVLQEARTQRRRLNDAIMEDAWSGMPQPVAAFYQEKLKGLSRKFRVTDVDVVIDESGLQADELEATLPITVYIQFQQKGRDGKQSLPIPSTWVWREQDGQMTLINVE